MNINSSSRRRNSSHLSRCLSETSPERTASRLSTDESADGPPSCQRGLPAFIYGEQASPSEREGISDSGVMSQPWAAPDLGITAPADSLQQYWGSLGTFVQSLLFKGVRVRAPLIARTRTCDPSTDMLRNSHYPLDSCDNLT